MQEGETMKNKLKIGLFIIMFSLLVGIAVPKIKTEAINKEYHVSQYATSGSGTYENPYSGWRDAIQVMLDESNANIVFDSGWYTCEDGTVDGNYKYCLVMYNSTHIKGIGDVWITQNYNVNLTVFIANYGFLSGADEDLSFYNTVDNIGCDGNTSVQYGGDYGTANCLMMYRSRYYTITNIRGKNYGRYGTVVFQGRDSFIDNINCDTTVFTGGWNYGDCVWITGATPQSQNNIVGKVIGRKIANVLVLEDYPQDTSVGQLTGYNLTGAVLSCIDCQQTTVGSIVGNDVVRGLSFSQNSHDMVVNTIMINQTKAVGGIQYEAVQFNYPFGNSKVSIGNLHVLNAGTALHLKNATNITIMNAKFTDVLHKLNYSGTRNGDVFIMEGGQLLEGNFGYAKATRLNVTNTDTNPAVYVNNAGNGYAMHINQVGDSDAVRIDSTGNSERALYIYTNEPATSNQAMVEFYSDNTAYDKPVCIVRQHGAGDGLDIVQDGAGDALDIDIAAVNGHAIDVDSDSTGYQAVAINGMYGLLVDNDITGGYGIKAHRQMASTSGAGSALLQAIEDHAGSSDNAVLIQQDGTGMHIAMSGTGTASCGSGDYGFYMNTTGIYACYNGVATKLNS